jgi:hypothetical protein
VVERGPGRDIGGAAPDHECDLGLEVDLLAARRQRHIGAGPYERVGEFGEEGWAVGQLLAGLVRVRAVVDPHADDLVRVGDGREQSDAVEGQCLQGRRVGDPLAQPVEQTGVE